MSKETPKRPQVGRQQVAPAAFEIRFSTTDSGLELVEIPPPNLDPQERNIPDPFKKRDKIPRNSGSGFTFENSGNDTQSTPTNNKQWNSISQKNKLLKDLNNTSSNGFDASIKTKLWNSVGPEAEKQERITYSKSKFPEKMEVDETATTLNSTVSTTRSKVDDESVSRRAQNNKKRSLPMEENGSDKENGSPTKETFNQNQTHSINKDLYDTNEMVVSTSKESMLKNINKNRKTSMTTENKDDFRTTSRPMDGIATPPETPPNSPPIEPLSQRTNSIDIPQAPSKTKEMPIPPSPLSSAGSLIIDNSSKPSTPSPSRIPRLSPSRPIITAYLKEFQDEQVEQERGEQEEQEQHEQEEGQEQWEGDVPGQQERGEHVQLGQDERQSWEKPKSLSRRRPTISHDDMIIPTIAKKLKMNGQLPFPNHDALLGTSDEQDPSSENGYVDVTNQVENLFDDEQMKLPERQSSVPELQQRKASLYKTSPMTSSNVRQGLVHRKDSKRIDLHAQVEETPSSTGRNPKSDEEKKRNRKSRREEYILVIRDEDEADEFGDIAEPHYSMSPTPEPSLSTTTTLLPSERDSAEHDHDESKAEEINNASSSTQSAPQGGSTPSSTIQLNVPNKISSPPLTLDLQRTLTSDPNEKKSKKSKKIKKERMDTAVDEDDTGYVKKSVAFLFRLYFLGCSAGNHNPATRWKPRALCGFRGSPQVGEEEDSFRKNNEQNIILYCRSV
ncbi:14731_t:CDS:2 [Acaulospora morrowiae]|uniref:14731_t:CDS:1 n=1 Tax=Acaulospora morrowiae TaxID=94023 RepID=A0A9N9CXI3_9GLOM|nr:14731_t:CDS:2 [Acaulospora morrowiae]